MSMNPIGGVQFRLSGGWRTAIILASLYAGATILISGLLYSRIPPEEHPKIHETLWMLVGIVQLVLLLMVAPGLIRRAVQRDFQTGMLESHRLTPMTGLQLVLGYLTGAPGQLFALAATGVLIGSGFAIASGRALGYPGAMLQLWLLANAAFVFLAAMILSLTLLTAIASRGKGAFIGIFIAIGVFGGGFLVIAIPGLALLLGVMSGALFVGAAGFFGPPATTNSTVGVWTASLQLLLTAVFVHAASRRVRAPHRALFNVPQGLVFLAICAAALVVGWHKIGSFSWSLGAVGDRMMETVASLIAFQVAALVPLLAAADYRLHQDRSRVLSSGRAPRKFHVVDLLPLVFAIAAVVLLLAMPTPPVVGQSGEYNATMVAAVFLAALLNGTLDYACFYIALARRWRLLLALSIVTVVLKIVPFAIEATLQVAAAEFPTRTPIVPWIAVGFSPLGAVITAAREAPLYGLAWQVVVVAAAVALMSATRRRVATRAGASEAAAASEIRTAG